ncbi:MAG: DUF4173 domain-containing protein [Clostridiales bacterium]|jgi:hypothetical protein|nr:DUF4173 domain-containing protein [Clostridiales bacterium]
MFELSEKSIEIADVIVNKNRFKVYLVLFLALCVLWIEAFFKSGIALGTVLWFVLAEVIAISFAKYSTGTINKKALLLCIPIGLINVSHLLFYSVSVQKITFPVALALFAIQLTYLSKPEKGKFYELFDFKNVYDLLHTVLINPFVYIPYPFKGLLKFRNENNKRIVHQVIIGILISIPIVVLFTGLFSSADKAFANFVGDFAAGIFSNLGVLIVDLIIGGIMCIFVSSLFVGANVRESTAGATKITIEVNNITLGTILVMVAMVVASYVVIQFNHWFGNIPEDFYQMDSYSASARGGFFELVAASFFLFVLIAAVTMISTKHENKLVPLIKTPLILLCTCNLIILYSAVEKMVIYINRSGITSRRILVLWFISVIVVCMIGQIIKIMRFSFKSFNFSFLSVTVLVCVLGFCNMDYYVAKNHIYLAENHVIQNLEINMLSELSYAAIGPIAEYRNRIENNESVYETTKMQSQTEVLRILDRELERHRNSVNTSIYKNPVMGFNFSRLFTHYNP